MIAGLSIENFTILHTAISLIAIASGLIVLAGMLRARRLSGWTALFLVTTILTSVTGFMFPINGLTPAIVVGLISIVILAIALMALYVKQLSGAWRWIYVTTALTALYFNVFVLIVQSFQKVPRLQVLAPTQSEPPVPDRSGRDSDRVSHSRHDGCAEISPRPLDAQAAGQGARETSAKKKEAAVAGGSNRCNIVHDRRQLSSGWSM